MSDAPDSDLTAAIELGRHFGFLEDFDHIIVAVSGGSDSMALLRLIDLWVSQEQLDRETFHVLTVDHGLRDGSADDAAFVEVAAKSLGFPTRTLTWTGDKPSSGLQALAREARYRLLCDAAKVLSGRGIILTAHTQDDQAETVLMRLARGSGPDGLSAIPALSVRNGVTIARPLLDLTRRQLVSLLQSLGQPWRDDPSNDLKDFERIHIRHAQSARQQLRLCDQALAQTARRMHAARQSLNLIAAHMLQQAAHDQPALPVGAFAWRPESMNQYGADVAIRCLRHVIHVIGGQSDKPNLSQVENLYDTLSDPAFRGTTLHGSRLVPVDNLGARRIFILRETGRLGLPDLTLEPNTTALWDGRFAFRTAPKLADGYRLRPLRPDDVRKLELPHGDGLPTCLWREVLLTLPALWCGDQLLCVPHFEACEGDITFDRSHLSDRLRSIN